MPVENVEDGVAPPWRCQACVKNDKYAVQRVVDVMRAENGQVYLLMEYLGYKYLEARPESWLEDKKGELRLAFKAHATVRPHKGVLYCGGALLEAMRSGAPVFERAGTGEQAGTTGEVSVLDQPCLSGEAGIVPGRGECIPDVS
jgi:hypothetical protein